MFVYVINKKNFTSKKELTDDVDFSKIIGFLLSSKTKRFRICDVNVYNIRIVNKKLANPIVSSLVLKKYDTLISQLFKLLVDADDDDGDSCRQVLDRIEKFRLQVKNKYRAYLNRQELMKMSKQLKLLQKQATEQFMEIQESLYKTSQSSKGR